MNVKLRVWVLWGVWLWTLLSLALFVARLPDVLHP
jgi:hypothetical protein